MAPRKKSTETIEIRPVSTKRATFTIVGTSPLITNCAWHVSEDLLERMTKKKVGRNEKDPESEYIRSLYWFSDGKTTGFPAVAMKAAMTRAAKLLGLTMVDTRGKFHVLGGEHDLIKIRGKHRKRSDMVRVANGSADVRFRAEYPEWEADVEIEYDSNTISTTQLAALIQQAGFSCGLLEWRPEKSNSGSFGRFALKTT